MLPLLLACLLAQDTDAVLKDRVERLVERLASDKADVRESAEKTLTGLGPKALPLLPDSAKAANDRQKQALQRIRTALTEAQEKASLTASRATIRGRGIRLTEALRQLQAQTGNRITDLREQAGGEATNPALDLDIADKPFFEALDLIAKQAGVALEFRTGDGSIGLMPGAPDDDKPDMIGVPPTTGTPLVVYHGPFRVQLKSIAANIDYAAGARRANAQLDVAWEPRLRPMLLALKAAELKILDDRGEEVAPEVTGESSNVVLRPENPVAEVNLNMAAPERQAGVKRLRSLKIKAEVTVPAGLRAFTFPSLAGRDVTVKQGDVALTLESTEVEETTWKVNVVLAMAGEGPAFESYRQGLFNNRIWLQKADGSRFEHNGGFSNSGSDGGRLSFEYIFVDAPGKPADYRLVYETPSRVLPIPLEFEFKDVELP